jgi:transcriptional regulator with XRE-family HTH domain
LRSCVDDRRISTIHEHGSVDSIRVGRILRALRHRLGWRQVDVARAAGASQTFVSRAERGDIERMEIRTLRRLATMLQAELVVMVRWRGGDLDRLLDEGHAALLGRVAKVLEAAGWVVRPEVTFSVYGERGSIDLVGWHRGSSILVIVEVKTELVSVEETLRRHDVKARLGARLVRERFGWEPRSVARLLVLPEASTPRRRVARQDPVLSRAYPLRGAAVRSWLRRPAGGDGALLFLSTSDKQGVTGRSSSVSRKRIRRSPGG